MVTQEIANPYFELLGIPESEQPANKYRLLGIPLFTTNENVIRNAAARQMQFLRRVGGDKYLDDVQQILNEVAEARLLLLDTSKRSSYDDQLRNKTTSSPEKPTRKTRKPTSVSLIALNGHYVGQEHEFSDGIRLGNSDDCAVKLAGINTEFLIHRQQNQWVIESPLATFALNDSLVEDRAFLKTGDIVRFKLDGPSFQFRIGSHSDEVGKWLENFPNCRLDPPQAVLAPLIVKTPDRDQSSTTANSNLAKSKYVKKKQGSFDWTVALFWFGVGTAIAVLTALIYQANN